MRIRRVTPILALAAAALLLPGCYAARGAFGSEPKSLAYSADWFSRTLSDQAHHFGEHLTGWPSALGSHVSECWTNITTDPRDNVQ